MAKHLAYGAEAEHAAARYLQQKGYAILCRNYRSKRAEIDLIAQKDKVLVFVEVQARATANFGWPEEAVTPRKQELLLTAAQTYIEEMNWLHDARFDIISVIGQGNNQQILHIEDAFH